MFSIEIRPKEKVFSFSVGGFFTPQEARDFLDTSKHKLHLIEPTEYTMVADGSGLQVVAQDLLPLLRECITLYKAVPFRKRYLIGMESHLALAQVQRVNREIGIDIEIVESIEAVKY